MYCNVLCYSTSEHVTSNISTQNHVYIYRYICTCAHIHTCMWGYLASGCTILYCILLQCSVRYGDVINLLDCNIFLKRVLDCTTQYHPVLYCLLVITYYVTLLYLVLSRTYCITLCFVLLYCGGLHYDVVHVYFWPFSPLTWYGRNVLMHLCTRKNKRDL